jgi:hypothetical protein
VPAPKIAERTEARRLRTELGMPMKQIAARLGVSVASVHAWTRDIRLTDDQWERNRRAGRRRFAVKWAEINRERRRGYQAEGRVRARTGDALHQAGCMLYWAEGAKDRGVLTFSNSDRAMVALFWRFLRECFDVDPRRVRIRLNVYLGNGLALHEIEDWWIGGLDVPRSCLRGHTINHFPTSSSGKKKNKLPYGVCSLRLYETRILQHIYGAIQEYAGFEEPSWLDGPPRKVRRRRQSSKPD